jgi:glycosyltransferase involved in cell wall biosynthesis
VTKPLLAVITYNRLDVTVLTLSSLRDTGAFYEANVVVWDNNSVDGTQEFLTEFEYTVPFLVFQSPVNIGCPRALNQIMHDCRLPSQHFIKVDNDVEMLTPGWVGLMCEYAEMNPYTALISASYDELEHGDQGRVKWQNDQWLELFPVAGHAVLHRGAFLDDTGFFDVFSPDHLYGFEDNLMAHRAGAMHLSMGALRAVRLRNLQRHNSLDVGRSLKQNKETRAEHVERLRPIYEQRCVLIHRLNGAYYVGSDGAPTIGVPPGSTDPQTLEDES